MIYNLTFPTDMVVLRGCSKARKHKDNTIRHLLDCKTIRMRSISFRQCYQLLPIRVTIYRPFSRSYTVFNWGFLHFDIDQAMNINIAEIAMMESSVGESLLIMVVIQSGCCTSELVVLCNMKAPKAQSSGIFSTWLAKVILLKIKFPLVKFQFRE